MLGRPLLQLIILKNISGPNLINTTPSTAPIITTTPVDVTVITNAVLTAMLAKPPSIPSLSSFSTLTVGS